MSRYVFFRDRYTHAGLSDYVDVVPGSEEGLISTIAMNEDIAKLERFGEAKRVRHGGRGEIYIGKLISGDTEMTYIWWDA